MPEEQGAAGGALTREQVLDELEFLATVEHALVVEYLSVACALGHDLTPEEGGAATRPGHDAAVEASELAVVAMFRLKSLNLGLAEAGRAVPLGRAAGVSSPSVAEIPLGPPSPAQLERLLEREVAIASAVEERYAELRPHPVRPAGTVRQPGLLRRRDLAGPGHQGHAEPRRDQPSAGPAGPATPLHPPLRGSQGPRRTARRR